MNKVWILLLALFLSSCGDSEISSVSGSPAGPNIASNLPLVIRSTGGVLDATGDSLELRLLPAGEEVLVGENAEGGVLNLGQFVSESGFGQESPGVGELEYQIEGQPPRRLPLSLFSLTREPDGTLVLQAVERIEVESSDVRAQFDDIFLSVQVFDGNLTVEGADVRADLVEDPTTFMMQTDRFGQALFQGVPFGTYNITVAKEGFRTQMAQTLVLQNRTRLVVHLVTDDSRALVSATLRVNP